MDLSHFFPDDRIEVYHVAISGMRMAVSGSWSVDTVSSEKPFGCPRLRILHFENFSFPWLGQFPWLMNWEKTKNFVVT